MALPTLWKDDSSGTNMLTGPWHPTSWTTSLLSDESSIVFSETLRLHPLATPTPYAMQSLSVSPPLLSTFFSTEGIRDLSELSLSQALLLPSVVILFLHLLPNTPFGGLLPQHEVSLFHSSSLSNIFLIFS